MTKVQVEGEISATPESVWTLVGDFGGFVKALGAPVELEGEGIGSVRTIAVGSQAIVERLDELDHEQKRITYSILQAGPLPVRDYSATMQLAPSGEDACRLTWSSTFEPEGVGEEDAVKAV